MSKRNTIRKWSKGNKERRIIKGRRKLHEKEERQMKGRKDGGNLSRLGRRGKIRGMLLEKNKKQQKEGEEREGMQ